MNIKLALLLVLPSISFGCIADNTCLPTEYCVPLGFTGGGTCQPRPATCTCINSSYGACTDTSLTCPACCWAPTIGCTTSVPICTAPATPPPSCSMVALGATCNNATLCCDWSAGQTCNLVSNQCEAMSVTVSTSSSSIGPCGPNILCGQVSSFENTAVKLKGVVVELRNRKGAFYASTKTDANGWYAFNTSSPSYVVPAQKRNWNAIPGFKYTAPSFQEDFKMRFVEFTLNVQGKPGSMVLITTGPVMGLPPSAGVGHSTDAYSGVVDTNGIATLSVPPAYTFWLTCWTYNRPSDSYLTSGSVAVAGTPANAQSTLTQACP